MSSGKIENQLLDAIQTVVDSAISKAGYDKTIQATIVKCVNESSGKYVVKYQDGVFYAYSSNSEISYTKGSNVYVLIPGNDTSAIKTIIGAVNTLGIDYIPSDEGDSNYEYVGNNIVELKNRLELCSYKDEQIIYLYNKDSQTQREDFSLNIQDAETYLKRSEYLNLSAYIQTQLPLEQRFSGNYGVVCKLSFFDNATGETIQRTYKMDINNMYGDPYDLSISTKQYAIYPIDYENFKSIDEIYVFQYGFPKTEEGHTIDIFIKDLELIGANKLPVDENSGCSLSIITPQGFYFDDKDISTTSRILQAQVRAKGQIIKQNLSILKYYWFKENNNINYTSSQFQLYGGPGWECLNEYTIVEGGARAWLPGTYQFSVNKRDVPAKETRYKCVVIYNDDIKISKEISILNKSSIYDVTIESSNGSQFYYDIGETTLSCLINSREEKDYSYSWSFVDSNGDFTTLDKDSNEILVKAREINQFSNYKCIVKKDGDIIGYAQIILYNSLEGALSYSAVINNGYQIFKYSTTGISPANEALEKPIEILPLTINLYDDTGTLIPEEAFYAQNVFWSVPKRNTLIQIPRTYEIHHSDDEYNYYNGYKQLNFNIANNYDAKKINNEIKLKIVYKDKILYGKTNFVFTKEGENGTNGTDFVCRIVPNVNNNNIPNQVMVTYNEDTSSSNWNFTPASANKYLAIELYHNGNRIFKGTQSGNSAEGNEPVEIQWSILKNNYDSRNVDNSNFTINKDTGVITFNSAELSNPANIVKCSVIYNNVEYYATMPILVAHVKNNYLINLKENSGFLSAMYTTDGRNPQYDTSSPFSIIVKNRDQEIEATEYNWSVKGNVYLAQWKTENNLIDKNLLSPSSYYELTNDKNYINNKTYYREENGHYIILLLNTDYKIGDAILPNSIYEKFTYKNEKYYKPIDNYNGMCVNNAVYCSAVLNGTEIANIHIPIYLYLNRYGNAAMNGWDGNNISINETNGTILAPQVGAGTKEEDNSFTGVFMGSVAEAGVEEIETGLFGYSKGVRTLELNSKNGSASFGTKGSGQIVISPNEGTEGHAYLRSGNYQENYIEVPRGEYYNRQDLYFRRENNIYIELKRNRDYQIGDIINQNNIYKMDSSGDGLEIDLTDPHIRFGSGGFRVDSDGKVFAREYATINSIQQGEINIPSQAVEGLDETKKTVSDLESSIKYLELLIPTYITNFTSDANRSPIETKDSTIQYTALYKGNPIKVVPTIKNTIQNLTIETSFNDTTKVGNITFKVQKGKILPQTVNIITMEFTYNGETIEKQFSVNLNIVGTDGVSITSTKMQYYMSTSYTAPTGGEWKDNPPTWVSGKYLWTKTIIYYSNNTHKEYDPICVTGAKGADGTSISILGSYNTYAELVNAHPVGSPGDAYIVDKDLYIWSANNNSWTDVGQIQGKDGVDGATAYLHIKYSNDGGKTFTNNTGEDPGAYMGQYTDFNKDDSTDVNSYTWSLIKGVDGTNGIGIKEIEEFYLISEHNSGITIQTPGWKEAKDGIPITTKEIPYLWNYEKITYTSENFKNTTPKIIGMYGEAGRGIEGVINYYLASPNESGITKDTPGWKTTVQTVNRTNRYLWNYEEITYNDNTFYTSEPAIINMFAEDGVSYYTYIKYSQHEDGSDFVDTPTNETKYIGICTISSPNPPTLKESYTWSKYIGEDGNTITIKKQIIEYALNDTNEEAPTAGWTEEIPKDSAGKYLWTRVTVIYSDDTEVVSYTVSYQSKDVYVHTKYSNDGGITFVDGSFDAIITENLYTLTTEIKDDLVTEEEYAGKDIIGAYMGTYVDNNQYASTNPADYTWVKIEGVGIEEIITYYLATSLDKNVTVETEGWKTAAPTTDKTNRYLWSFEEVIYTDKDKPHYKSAPAIIGTYSDSPYNVLLTNESQSIAGDTTKAIATTITTGVIGYQGSAQVDTIVDSKTITGLPTGITATVSGSGGKNTVITFTVTNSLTTKSGQITIPVKIGSTTINKIFSYSLSLAGAAGQNGQPGQAASLVDINASSQIFKSTDGGITFAPDIITLTPRFQTVSYSKWQYSLDGGSNWSNVTSGSQGLVISNGILAVSKTSALFTDSITSVIFKCVSSDSAVYDTITILKLYDVKDMEIGVRNYALKSNEEKKIDNNSSWISYSLSEDKDYLASKTIQISFDAKRSATSKNSELTAYLRSENGIVDKESAIIKDLTTSYKRYMVSIVAPDDISNVIQIAVKSSITSGIDIDIKNMKVEIGTNPTDWSPAPEDIDSNFGTINGTINNILNTTIPNINTNYDNLSGRVDGLAGNIKGYDIQIQNNWEASIKEIYIEYCQKYYTFSSVAENTTYNKAIVYYERSGSSPNYQYTKVRPEVKNGKIQKTVYVKNTLALPTAADEQNWYKSKPTWVDGSGIYQRTTVEYNNGSKVSSTPFLMEDYQTIDDLRYVDATDVLSTMRGSNYIFYNEDGFYCYNAATEQASTHYITLNHQGIVFGSRPNTSANWENKSVWKIEGVFDAKDIRVENLSADAIVDGILTLGNSSKDGELRVQDDEGKNKIELNSQRAIYYLNSGGHVIIGKDIGIQVLDANNEIQYGSSLTWTPVSSGKYQNNVNYYTEQGNLMSLIIPERTGSISGTVYTVSCGDVFELKQQKVTTSINFGDTIKTVNIDTTDSENIKHKGLAFVAI